RVRTVCSMSSISGIGGSSVLALANPARVLAYRAIDRIVDAMGSHDHPTAEHDHHDHHDHHERPAVERRCDVVVVGGSAAGLAAALQLGRQRRSVIVVDAGEPRNAPAAHMHSYLGRDGTPPAALTEAGRAEVRSYGGE